MSDLHDPTGDAAQPGYTIDNPPPRRRETPEERADASWQRMCAAGHPLRHLRPRILERAPIRLYGKATDGWGHWWFLYRDAQGRRRVFTPEEHARDGIASLFEGVEDWLPHLWPALEGGWDDELAAETLMHFSACIGLVNAGALGFELPPAKHYW